VKHRKGLDLVAEALLEQETIDGALVARLIQKGIDRNVEGNSSGESAGRPEHDTL
jgi:cell division protease FtsH